MSTCTRWVVPSAAVGLGGGSRSTGSPSNVRAIASGDDGLALSAGQVADAIADPRDRREDLPQELLGLALHRPGSSIQGDPICRPKNRFLTTSRFSHRASPWNTVTMPSAGARRGRRSAPACRRGRSPPCPVLDIPPRILTSVDLPAPFSGDRDHLAAARVQVDVREWDDSAEPLRQPAHHQSGWCLCLDFLLAVNGRNSPRRLMRASRGGFLLRRRLPGQVPV